jgi:hypothetical protein
VIAAEPVNYPTVYSIQPLNSLWDTGTSLYFQDTNPGADWIWETVHAEDPATVYDPAHPLYDADASMHGRVVVFEKKFTIAGTPQDSMLDIATDNGWEVWINGAFLARSVTAADGWITSNLHEAFLNTTNWQNVGHVTVPASMLVCGENTIKIFAGNEYFASDDAPNFTPAFTSNPYAQYNPGGLIFKMDISYEPGRCPCRRRCCCGDIEVENENQAVVINNIEVEAETGDNEIEGRTGGRIITGNAVASTSLLNVINRNITRIRR